MDYNLYINIENSLKDFLDEQIVNESGFDTPEIRVGRKEDNIWSLPCITIFFDSETAPRGFIGSNQRLDTQLIIFDIYATNERERLVLANWLVQTINNGCDYNEYSTNPENPYSPLKAKKGMINVDFLSNTRVDLGLSVDTVDSHRHRISINAWVSGIKE